MFVRMAMCCHEPVDEKRGTQILLLILLSFGELFTHSFPSQSFSFTNANFMFTLENTISQLSRQTFRGCGLMMRGTCLRAS